MSNGDAFSGHEKPSGGGDGSTRERARGAGSRALQGSSTSQAFTFHGAQRSISTLGRKGIGAGMAQSHWGTPRAAAAKSVLKRSQSKAGGRERIILDPWEKGAECALYGSATPASHRGQFKIVNSTQSPACLHHEAAEWQRTIPIPAACWDFMAFISAMKFNRMAEPLP